MHSDERPGARWRGQDPCAYLKDVLTRLSTQRPNEITDLLQRYSRSNPDVLGLLSLAYPIRGKAHFCSVELTGDLDIQSLQSTKMQFSLTLACTSFEPQTGQLKMDAIV